MGERHRPIRARSAPGQVAGAATESHGLEAHRPNRCARPAFSTTESPVPGEPLVGGGPGNPCWADFHAPNSTSACAGGDEMTAWSRPSNSRGSILAPAPELGPVPAHAAIVLARNRQLANAGSLSQPPRKTCATPTHDAPARQAKRSPACRDLYRREAKARATSTSSLCCPRAPRPRTTRLRMQNASLHPVTPALQSARTASRTSPPDACFHDGMLHGPHARVAATALTKGAAAALVLSPSRARHRRRGRTTAPRTRTVVAPLLAMAPGEQVLVAIALVGWGVGQTGKRS